jgi:hypothetical protein
MGKKVHGGCNHYVGLSVFFDLSQADFLYGILGTHPEGISFLPKGGYVKMDY